MIKNLNIASRKSILAMWQSNYIKEQLQQKYPAMDINIIKSNTKGDIILDTPLAKIGGKGLFTKEIEDLMLENKAQIAVHSLKDMATSSQDGLKLVAVSKREDPRDAFVSFKYKSLDDLPNNAIVGTTSLRRGMQLRIYNKNLTIVSLRGNVQSRLEKLKNGEFDAIILAYSGLKRLDLLNFANFIVPIDTDILIPSMGQGALGIESRDEKEIIDLISILDDKNTNICTHIEREFVHTLNGGCQAPIGVYASIIDETINIKAIVGVLDGSDFIKKEENIHISKYKNFAKGFAEKFIDENAMDLLAKSEKLFEKLLN